MDILDNYFDRSSKWIDLAKLILRLQAGLLMLTHGWPKLQNFAERSEPFADPFGVSSPVSLSLVIFAEVFCSVLLIVGWKTRWVVIPLIITMLVIIFDIQWDDPFRRKELPLMFLGAYISLLMAGAGSISLDRWLRKGR